MRYFSIEKYYPQLLLLVLFFAFCTRMYRLNIPETYVFDEVYHAVTAKLIAQNDIRAYEWHNPPPEPNTAVDWLHPPLAKYFQALSMLALGQNSFGWRFSSAIFGVLVVFLTAKLLQELFANKTTALLAALLVSLDGLTLTMSRIAMNDIHVTAFILLSLVFYVQYRNSARTKTALIIAAGCSAGLAVGSKWSGVFSIVIIGFSEGIYWLQHLFTGKTKHFSQKLWGLATQLPLLFISLLFIPAVLYLASYGHMFSLGKDFNHLVEMHKNTWWYQTNLTATHPAQSTPYQWFLNLRPVWLAVGPAPVGYTANIYAVSNPVLTIFVVLSVIATISFFAATLIRKKTITLPQQKLAFLTLAYFSVWAFWQLSPRIMFFYHYLPAIPLGSGILAFWLEQLLNGTSFRQRAIGRIAVMLIFVGFVVWYPHWTLLPVPIEFAEDVYFALPGWKQQ